MKIPLITNKRKTKRNNMAAVIALSLALALLTSTALPIAAMASADAIAATDHTNSVSAGEVKQALRYTPGILEESSATQASSGNDTALNVTTAGATIDVPKDASDSITLSTPNGPRLDIDLPGQETSTDAKQIANGVVAYESSNGSANAVQANQDGSVRMLTVIDNKNAPTEYDYKVTVPNGGHIELTTDGGAIVVDDQGQPIALVQTPWAKDARGKLIKTWFTTNGITLTQHVKHNVRGIVYPVVADPTIQWHWYGADIYIEQRYINRIIALMGMGAGAMGLGAAVTGGTGAVPAAVGAALLGIGSGAISWCSSKNKGMWIHIRPGITWCNNG